MTKFFLFILFLSLSSATNGNNNNNNNNNTDTDIFHITNKNRTIYCTTRDPNFIFENDIDFYLTNESSLINHIKKFKFEFYNLNFKENLSFNFNFLKNAIDLTFNNSKNLTQLINASDLNLSSYSIINSLLTSLVDNSPIPKCVISLDFSNNTIDYISNDFFLKFKKLNLVNLSRNRIKHLDNLLISIGYLMFKLNDNLIESIREIKILDNHSGIYLHLENNPIKYLPILYVKFCNLVLNTQNLTLNQFDYIKNSSLKILNLNRLSLKHDKTDDILQLLCLINSKYIKFSILTLDYEFNEDEIKYINPRYPVKLNKTFKNVSIHRNLKVECINCTYFDEFIFDYEDKCEIKSDFYTEVFTSETLIDTSLDEITTETTSTTSTASTTTSTSTTSSKIFSTFIFNKTTRKKPMLIRTTTLASTSRTTTQTSTSKTEENSLTTHDSTTIFTNLIEFTTTGPNIDYMNVSGSNDFEDLLRF
ncbi:unnamed protein product [Brachionus calyciflorus]|uniref:Uncharacterized protein n=1 Tax=Brachionus calyciflorus TaxID=104777 RepID=A0A813M4W8_9BILA|nr:unnamed protein product [Brachionus calyciflorus]